MSEIIKKWNKERAESEKKAEAAKPKYWLGTLGTHDDFGIMYQDVMIDGRTKHGPWANMTAESWRVHGCGKLGTGCGQKYKKQSDGRWLKVEG